MERDPIGLRDDGTLRVRNEAGEIMRVAEDRAPRCPQHNDSHLLRDMVQPVLNDRKADWIELHRAAPSWLNSIKKLPAASTKRWSPGPTNTVVVSSSMIRG